MMSGNSDTHNSITSSGSCPGDTLHSAEYERLGSGQLSPQHTVRHYIPSLQSAEQPADSYVFVRAQPAQARMDLLPTVQQHSPRAPKASLDCDDLSLHSNHSSVSQGGEDTPLLKAYPAIDPRQPTSPKDPLPSRPCARDHAAETRHQNATTSYPHTASFKGMRYWASQPNLIDVDYPQPKRQDSGFGTDNSQLSEFSRGMSKSSSNLSQTSTSTGHEVIILHTSDDRDKAENFKKTVVGCCKGLDVKTWYERCTAGVCAKDIQDEILTSSVRLTSSMAAGTSSGASNLSLEAGANFVSGRIILCRIQLN